MKLNQACRLLGSRVDELTDEAEKLKQGLIVLITDPAALAHGRAIEGSFGEAAVALGDALQDISRRLHRLNDVVTDLQSLSSEAGISSG
jgi:hypothetical protein